MWMTAYIREVKRQLRDVYGFSPDRTVDGEPCFNLIPDGLYPMLIEGKIDEIRIAGGKIFCT